ncbi:PfkB family carbohydrate kinase [Georgenia sp. MJ173]|uniref:carbohydrate kinase family protein n=1 Tax=Georgenia sunbinii TaxID=3117728 RepID=UPI002F2691EF
MAGDAPVGLFVGLTTMDVLHRTARPPAPNEKVTATRQDVAAGGPAANAAVTFAALGGRPRLLTGLGASAPAVVAGEDLRRHGVAVVDAAAPDYPLAVSAVVVVESTGERSVVSPDAGLADVPAPDDVDLDGVTVVLLDGHHPALARATLAALDVHDARGTHGPTPGQPARPVVVLDCGRWRPVFDELLPVADVAALSADFRVPGVDGGPAETARAVLARGARAVVITDGGHPVRWWAAGTSGSHAVGRVPVRDTLGAGDAFHGGLAAALAHGQELATAVALASEVAGRRVASVGPRDWLTGVPRWWP